MLFAVLSGDLLLAIAQHIVGITLNVNPYVAILLKTGGVVDVMVMYSSLCIEI